MWGDESVNKTDKTRNWLKTATAIAGVLAAALYSFSSVARAERPEAVTCNGLETIDFSTIPDAPTQVMEANLQNAIGELPSQSLPRARLHCATNRLRTAAAKRQMERQVH